MIHLVFVAFIGFIISFLGQLPVGTMSVTATYISIENGNKNAWKYSFGVAIVEIIYLRIILNGIHIFNERNHYFKLLDWVSVVLFLVIGIAILLSANQQNGNKSSSIFNAKKINSNFFSLGAGMSSINAAQIPFWLMWSNIVLAKNLMAETNFDFNSFTFGTGIGTLLGLGLYIYLGKSLITKWQIKQQILSKAIGITFIFLSVFQGFSLIR